MSIIDMKEMSEEDIKVQFVNKVLQEKGWYDKILCEKAVKFTDGQINISGNKPTRGKGKTADYVLYLEKNLPIAIIEAESNKHPVSYGMQQCKEYADMMKVMLAYSTNGEAFDEYDYSTGVERELPLDEFPTPEELRKRYEESRNGGTGITDAQKKIQGVPYYSNVGVHSPRYYQRIAVNRTVDAIAAGEKRVLLAMATGTGKTYTAFQIVHRLIGGGFVHKVLYLADRNFLIKQTMEQDFKPLERVSHKVNFLKDDKTQLKSYNLYFALYQQISGDGSDEDDKIEQEDADGDGAETAEEVTQRYAELFDKDYFDLIIVDECHRGSAKKNSRWRAILEYFSSAAQIGMTATPKETREVSNIDYFGEPLYEYSLKQGILDGFLAPFKVISPKMDVDSGWRPYKDQRDIHGYYIDDKEYNVNDFGRTIVLEDRDWNVADQITKFLKDTDRMSKTIVFCETEAAAERMRIALANLNSDMMQQKNDYVVRITGSDNYGKSKLDYFISTSSEGPVIATTSRLLATGADCKLVKLIAIDENISDMCEFKQILGRGTRLNEKLGKTHFTIMDFRGVTRLFADPDWDGPIEQDEGYDPEAGPEKKNPKQPGAPDTDPGTERKPVYVVDKNGCRVEIVQTVVSIYDASGKLIHQENIIDYTRAGICEEYASLDRFIRDWTTENKKELLERLFKDRGIDLQELKKTQDMADVDDFDFICHLAYDSKPLTRRERAENVKKRDIFSKYGPVAQEILGLLLDKYADGGITEIENKNILGMEPFTKYGKPAKIAQIFGGKEAYDRAIQELERELYEAA